MSSYNICLQFFLEGGAEFVSMFPNDQEKKMIKTVVQLDGDVINLVAPGASQYPQDIEQHFMQIDAARKYIQKIKILVKTMQDLFLLTPPFIAVYYATVEDITTGFLYGFGVKISLSIIKNLVVSFLQRKMRKA